MIIKNIKALLPSIELILRTELLAHFTTIQSETNELKVYLTQGLMKVCKKKKKWKSPEFLITLKNVKYGIDSVSFRSKGGRDGIFIVDENFKPKNEMQRKIFDQFMYKKSSSFKEIIAQLAIVQDSVLGVRVVSHHMRLLGIYGTSKNKEFLVLINYDDSK